MAKTAENSKVNQKSLPQKIACRSCGTKGPFRLVACVTDLHSKRDPLLKVTTCSACGICFLNPQYTAQDYNEFYSSLYYGAKEEDDLRLRVFLKDQYSVFMPAFSDFLKSLPKNARYLDMGAGSGIWLDFMKELVDDFVSFELHALEPSIACIENLKKRFPHGIYSQGMLESNDYSDEMFDGVLCSALIEHFNDPLFSVLHMNRIVRVGGRVLFMTPALNEKCLVNGPEGFFKYTHTFYFTEESMRSLLEKAGFEVEWCRYFPPNAKVRFPSYIVSAKKFETRYPKNVEKYRQLTELDRKNLAATNRLMKEIGRELKIFTVKTFAFRAAKRILPKPVRTGLKSLITRRA